MKLHVKILLCFLFVYGMICGQEVPFVEYYGEMVNASNACVKAPIILKSSALTETISTSEFQLTEPDNAYYKLTEDQRKAAKYVLSIFSKLIVSSVPIKVFITREDFGEITGSEPKPLAKSKATSYYNNNNTVPFLQNTQYPIALAEAIKGENLNTDNNEIEIILNKNENIPWNIDTMGLAVANKFDFVTVIMHEIMHGLGFATAAKCSTDSYSGSIGFAGFPQASANIYPTIFDKFIVNSLSSLPTYIYTITDASQIYNNLTGNSLYFRGPKTLELLSNMQLTNSLPKLYAPSTWSSGSSIAHFDENSYTATNNNSLMTPKLKMQEVIHSPGELGAIILEDLGFIVNPFITVTTPNNSTQWTRGTTCQVNITCNKAVFYGVNMIVKSGNTTYIDQGITINQGNNQYSIDIGNWFPEGYYNLFFEVDYKIIGKSEDFRVIPEVVATPTISPLSGSFMDPQLVTITCSTNGAQIFYAINDDPNGENAIQYSVPFTVNPPATIRAVGRKLNFTTSQVAQVIYTFSGVIVKQLTSNGIEFGNFDEWKNNSWMNHPTSTKLPKLDPTIVRADTNVQFTTEKYQRWLQNYENPTYLNWLSINLVNTTINDLTAKFENAYLTTIQTTIDGYPANISNAIKIKDPWLMMDIAGENKGRRNKGLAAEWVVMNTPFTPAYSTSQKGYVFKGVFPNAGGYNVQSLIPPYYSIGINNNPVYNNKTCYFQKWSQIPINNSVSAEFTNANSAETPVLFKQANAVITAELKGSLMSNNAGTFEENGQRKIIRTTYDNNLHAVYESMGKIWYEKSTNNGGTWQLMNNHQPLNTNEAKNPSIAFESNGYVFITFQEMVNSSSNIKVIMVNYEDDYLVSTQTLPTLYSDNTDIHPVIGIASYNSWIGFMLAWDITENLGVFAPGGIYYAFGKPNDNFTSIDWDTPQIMPLTNSTCSNPTVMGNRSNPAVFHFAYQQDVTSTSSSVWYQADTVKTNEQGEDFLSFPTTRMNVSSASGYTKNYKPSLVEFNGGARMCWIGERTINDEDPDSPSEMPETNNRADVKTLYKTNSYVEKRVVFKTPTYYRYWNFGNNVQAPTITKPNDNTAYIVGWNETTNNNNKFVDNTLDLSPIKNFGISGSYVQVANAPTKQEMVGLVYNTSATPYSFTKTEQIGYYYGIPKSLEGENGGLIAVNHGRQGLVVKDSLQFFFALGDITNGDKPVNFTSIPEDYAVTNLESVNNALVSTPFSIKDGESFLYSVQYGLIGSQNAQLPVNKSVSFKVKLLDANTNELIREFDNVTYQGANIQKYNNILYQVNINGIGSKTVKMCLEVNDNLGGTYSITDRSTDDDILAKANIHSVNLTENINITSYDLFQNYPNPFNPSTTISYQVPDNCRVTLKVFDVLGKEVTTLVDEYKSKGKYDVQFNAKHLASGMYIYQIKAGDFVSSKKLMLMK